MATFQGSLAVDDITALKAIASSSRGEGSFHAVNNDGTGYGAWYRYNPTSTTVEDIPVVVTPTDGVGRFFQFKGKTVSDLVIGSVSTLPPGATPTVVNSGTERNIVLDFGIPEGSSGGGGDKTIRNLFLISTLS